MYKKLSEPVLRYFKSLSRWDWGILNIFLGGFFLSWGSEVYAVSKADESIVLPKISDLISVEIAYKFLLISGLLVFISTVVRFITNDSSDKSWRYLAIIAFSIVGSVVVALITSEKSMPGIWALAIGLFHLGYWCWRREHIETSLYQSSIKATTERLDRVVNQMPNEIAFKVMGKETTAAYGTLSVISKMSIFADNVEDKAFIAEKARDQINKALESMCHIASLWTVSKARLFEANIMFVKSSDDIRGIDKLEEAFERGKYFFPDMTSLGNMSDMCNKVLHVVPELAINSEESGKKIDISPLLLPVGLKSTIHPGVIMGAPEAVETGVAKSIEDVQEIVDGLPGNYVDVRKKKIEEYFEGQSNCGSILSIPLSIIHSPDEDLGGDEGLDTTVTVDAVINLYRPEKGLIKSVALFQDFTKPLVLLMGNLLYLYKENFEAMKAVESEKAEKFSNDTVSESDEINQKNDSEVETVPE